MRSVYLVRHAFAGHADAAQWPDDAKRPLTADGSERFRAAARGLRVLVPNVERVFSSGFARAWQTAELLHKVSAWPEAEECPALEVGRSAASALDVVRESEEGSVALVGHEPFLSRLASLLCAGDEDALRMKLKKGGVVSIEIDRDVHAGSGCLIWSVTPKQLRLIAR